MARIYDRVEKRSVKVQSMKNLTFEEAPNYKFFLHKRYIVQADYSQKDKGYTVSERTSGCALSYGDTPFLATLDAQEKLRHYGEGKLKKAVDEALEVQKNDKR